MSSARLRAGLWARLALIIIAAVSGGRCATESVTAPSGSTLTLTTPARSVSVNGTAVLTAQLVGSTGQPQVGASIGFTTTLGTIEPAQAVTNASGQVTVVFSAGSASGTAVIRATSGGVQANPVNLVVGTAAVGRVALTASPAAVPFNGGTAVVTALVTDGGGNPLPAMPMAFTTTAGTITPANAKTDNNGLVQVTLGTTATAVITAIAGVSPGDIGAPAGALIGTLTVPLATRPAPVVSIAAAGNPVAGTPVSFTVGAAPAPSSNTTIQRVTVSFGDGDSANLGATSGAAIVVQHLYLQGGTYTASVTATDSAGATSTASTVIVVAASTPLTVSVVAGPMVPAGGGPNAIVTFTASVLPAATVISGYVWDFGDGTPVQPTTGAQVQHVFAAAGLYRVTVTATQALTGLTATGSVPVSTASGMPVVSIVPPATLVTGRPATFTIGASVAPGSNATMRSVVVDFGDGATQDLGTVTGSAISATHLYGTAGTYLVRVTATDTAGGVASATTQVVVSAGPMPTVSVAASANAVARAPVTFTVNAAAAAGSTSTVTSVSINFGDNSPAVSLGAVNGTVSPQHTYLAAGTYTVTVTATDSNQQTASASTQVVVTGAPVPTVSVSASSSAVAGAPVTFTVTTAPAAGSNAPVTNVSINFGDNTAPGSLGALNGTGTTQHTYAAPGTYTVTATVTDSNQQTATAATQVVVGTVASPTVSVSASANGVAGTAVTFTVTAAAAPNSGTSITAATIAFQANATPVNLGAINGTTTTQHVYTAAGTYTATVVVTDGGGRTATASTQVVIAPRPVPSVTIGVVGNPVAGGLTSFNVVTTPAAGGLTPIQSVVVDFGDGTATVDLGALVGAGTTQHVYASTGTYTATVTVTDLGNASGTATTTFVVAAPVAVAVSSSTSPVSCLPTTLTVTSTLSPSFSIQSVVLRFGDGTQSSGITSPYSAARTYGTTGTFAASAVVTVIGSGNVPVQVTATHNVVVAACPVLQHTFTATAVDQATLYRWPGGTDTFALMPGLSVTINVPSGTISNLTGDTWSIASAVGYSTASCTITPEVPNCSTLGSSSSLLGNGRPYCSNASVVFASGAPTARAVVRCTYP